MMTIEQLNNNSDITLIKQGEKWRPYPDGFYGEKYAISNLGRIYSLSGRRFISFFKHKGESSGRVYYQCNFYYRGCKLRALVHRLVAKTWVLNVDKEHNLIVDHINNDPKDNRAVNLRWVTIDYNNYLARNNEQQKYTRWLIKHWNDGINYEECE